MRLSTQCTYYPLWYRLEGQDAYLLWYSDDRQDDSNNGDGVVLAETGRVASFGNLSALQYWAAKRGLEVSAEVSSLHNLDLVKDRFACQPLQEASSRVDCDAFLTVWNLFTDVETSCGAHVEDLARQDRQDHRLYEKLFRGSNLPSVTQPGQHDTLLWSNEEIARLRDILGAGLQRFRDNVLPEKIWKLTVDISSCRESHFAEDGVFFLVTVRVDGKALPDVLDVDEFFRSLNGITSTHSQPPQTRRCPLFNCTSGFFGCGGYYMDVTCRSDGLFWENTYLSEEDYFPPRTRSRYLFSWANIRLVAGELLASIYRAQAQSPNGKVRYGYSGVEVTEKLSFYRSQYESLPTDET